VLPSPAEPSAGLKVFTGGGLPPSMVGSTNVLSLDEPHAIAIAVTTPMKRRDAEMDRADRMVSLHGTDRKERPSALP
jgi:hypothetical protein